MYGGGCCRKDGYSDYFRIALFNSFWVVAGGSGCVVVMMVRVVVRQWWRWWHNGCGSGSGNLCSYIISRTAIFKYKVMLLVV